MKCFYLYQLKGASHLEGNMAPLIGQQRIGQKVNCVWQLGHGVAKGKPRDGRNVESSKTAELLLCRGLSGRWN